MVKKHKIFKNKEKLYVGSNQIAPYVVTKLPMTNEPSKFFCRANSGTYKG